MLRRLKSSQDLPRERDDLLVRRLQLVRRDQQQLLRDIMNGWWGFAQTQRLQRDPGSVIEAICRFSIVPDRRTPLPAPQEPPPEVESQIPQEPPPESQGSVESQSPQDNWIEEFSDDEPKIKVRRLR